MPCAIVALLSLCLSCLCFGLSVPTRSRPYGLCHCPYTLAHIKGFGSHYLQVYIGLLLCFMLVLASLVLGFATFDALSKFVVICDAHKALFRCNHLGYITMMLVASCTPFPSSILCHVMLTMLGCTTRWLYMHLYTLAYMSMHESCLLVSHPYFNTIKSWTSNPNLHLSLVDATFYLFSCLFVSLLSCFFVSPLWV